MPSLSVSLPLALARLFVCFGLISACALSPVPNASEQENERVEQEIQHSEVSRQRPRRERAFEAQRDAGLVEVETSIDGIRSRTAEGLFSRAELARRNGLGAPLRL